MESVSEYDLKAFSPDYRRAREAFLCAAEASGARVSSYAHPLRGPEDEVLTTEVAWLGADDAQTVLVLLCATHGVEGFSGSAAQIDFLTHMKSLPSGVAVLLVHAVNPHGFAWLRRVTGEGVDLNRNYIDFSRMLPFNDGYDELADAIVPVSLAAGVIESCDRRLSDYLEAHGSEAYEKALSAGQYNYPHGLFYGGMQATRSRLICEKIISDFRLPVRKRVAVLDFHTGLGPFGYGEPICDHPPKSPGIRLARLWYGDSVTEPALGTSSSVVKHGLSDFGWMHLVGEPLVFIALEFGTYSFDQMKQVLRADHWLHAQGTVDWHDERTQTIKAAIRKHFYPATADWQEMVLMRCRQCIRQALSGLAAEAGG